MKRPFVFINVAMTADGKIDTFERKGASISSQSDKERVDRLRAESDAVMVARREWIAGGIIESKYSLQERFCNSTHMWN